MLTSFGKELRKLRIERGELMKDMAEGLGVTVSYLSAIENGKRNVPRSWITDITEMYELSSERQLMLQESLYRAQESIEISLKNKDQEDLDVLFALARSYEALGSEEKQKIFEILNHKE